MRKRNWRKLARDFTLVAIIAVAIIDGVLIAVVRQRFSHDHGYDLRMHRRAVAKPAPP
jgi:hypothetical protein